MDSLQCNHFELEVEELRISGVPVVLRVPIRRCRLAERMVTLLALHENGKEIVSKITLPSSRESVGGKQSSSEEAPAQTLRVAFGPDLEAIHAQECTVQRCKESCTPGFKMLLHHFGYDEVAEAETGDDCSERRNRSA